MSIATSNLSLVFGEMIQVAQYSLATWETEALVRQQSLLPRLWDKPTPRTPASYYRTPKEKYDIPSPSPAQEIYAVHNNHCWVPPRVDQRLMACFGSLLWTLELVSKQMV